MLRAAAGQCSHGDTGSELHGHRLLPARPRRVGRRSTVRPELRVQLRRSRSGGPQPNARPPVADGPFGHLPARNRNTRAVAPSGRSAFGAPGVLPDAQPVANHAALFQCTHVAPADAGAPAVRALSAGRLSPTRLAGYLASGGGLDDVPSRNDAAAPAAGSAGTPH